MTTDASAGLLPPKSRWTDFWGDSSAAAVVTLSALSFYLSAASLLFQGGLLPHLPAAIGAALLGGALLAAVGAWRGSLPQAALGAEPATVPVLAALTANVAAVAPAAALLPTTVVTLALAAVAVGATWWLMGQRGWGDLIRYVPYPVVGGFLAAIGWLMLTGGLGVAMGQGFTLARAAAWLGGAADLRLLVGLGLGVLIWRVTLHFKQPLTLPLVLLVGITGIHTGLRLAGLDIAEAQAKGWLLAPFIQTVPIWPATPTLLAEVRWDIVLHQLPLIASLVIVATIGLLLSDTSLEVAWDQRADINRDLRVLGQGNLLVGAMGGLVGGISISRSILNRAAGAAGRVAGALSAGMVALALVWGGPVIALMPRPLLGGMLVYLGLGMLKAWLFDSRPRLTRWEHATVVGMVAVTALAGFLSAVGVGVLVCCLGFVVSSSRLSPVRRLLTRAAWPSRVERPLAKDEWLQRQGRGLTVVELQGTLFFGSTTRLAAQIEALLAGTEPPQCLLFDFHHVRGLDTSAAQSMARLFKVARAQGVAVALSRLDARGLAVLAAAGAADAQQLPRHADIDAAVAAWDEAQLAAHGSNEVDFETAMQAQLPPDMPLSLLLSHFRPLDLAPGDTLFNAGDIADALYLVRSGRLSAWVHTPEGEVSVRSVMAGSAVGEMGLFRRSPRSATVRADGACTVLRLSEQALHQMAADQPAVAAALYRLFVLQMASRVAQLTAQANALAR
jgi:SulP family sulfate permease